MTRAGRIGVISDTHGLLRPEALSALRGVERILHAGDVGSPEVLAGLRGIAPVDVVRGNVDRGPWAESLPLSVEIEIAGRWIVMIHILDDLAIDPRGAGFAAVISGHSHRPVIERRGGVLYLNPGSAGPRRFDLPVTLAVLDPGARGLQAEIVRLLD